MSRFASAAMAEAYARSRPPLHERVVERIASRAESALDVGCGAGLSTRPLLKIAEKVTGVDPAPEMAQWGPKVAKGAEFAAARAEALPFPAARFDLITAAGSLNYAEPAAAFAELRRVIRPAGTLAVYDWSQVDFPYERPSDGAIALSPGILAEIAAGFRVSQSKQFEYLIEMNRAQYVAYLESELGYAPDVDLYSIELCFRGYIAWLKPVGQPLA